MTYGFGKNLLLVSLMKATLLSTLIQRWIAVGYKDNLSEERERLMKKLMSRNLGDPIMDSSCPY